MKKYFTSFFLVILAVALAAEPASATILFAGGEDLDFTAVGSALGVNTSSCFNATYSREAVYTTSQNGPYYLESNIFTSSSTFWTHFDWGCNTASDNSANWWVVFNDSSGINRLYIKFNTGSYPDSLKLYKINAAGTSTLLATSVSTVYWNVETSMDIYINYSASGTFTVYQNGNQIVTYSGDVTTDGNASLAQLELGSPLNAVTYYSQVIVSTTDTRSEHLATMYPAANGNTMAWTGLVSNINPTTYNDSNLITSATSGQLAEFTASSLPSGSYTVQAVVQSARALATAGGPQNLEFDTRTGGTSYQTANQTLSTAMSHYYYVWSTNPNTGVAWTTSDLGAAGFNLGVESQT